MTATNHALTGALIGLTVSVPLAFVLAVLSHFVLDALPHYGSNDPDSIRLKKISFEVYLWFDFLLCVSLVVSLRFGNPAFWIVPSICAFLATSPDLVSANRYFKVKSNKPWKPSLFSRFASGIQWFERPIGAAVEIVWFICAVIILAKIILK